MTNAATKIGSWRIIKGSGDEKIVVGYNASEADFTEELEKLKRIANLALAGAKGTIISSDEDEILNATFNLQGESIIDASIFFNQ